MTNLDYYYKDDITFSLETPMVSFGNFLLRYKPTRNMEGYWTVDEDTYNIKSTKEMFEIWLNSEYDAK